jgi:hypothetical protein
LKDDIERAKEEWFLEFVSLSAWEVFGSLFAKTCAGGWGFVPCKYFVVVFYFSLGRLSSNLLLACGRSLFSCSPFFVLNLGWPNSVLLSCDNGTRLV